MEEAYKTKERIVGPTKGRYFRQIPINKDLEKFLRHLRKQTGKTPYVLPRLQKWDKGEQARILRTFCKEINMKPLKFHALRGSFATELMRQGVAPATVRKICGWEDAETMEHYIDLAAIGLQGVLDSHRVIPDKDAMAKVVNLFSAKK